MLPPWLLWSLPFLFVLHDAEETLFLPAWLRRNRPFLLRRLPVRFRRLVRRLPDLSPRMFAAMAAEELLLLLLVTALALGRDLLQPWLSLYLAFGLHLLLHLGQWLVVGRYVPIVATSLGLLPFWLYGISVIWRSALFAPGEWVLCGLAGCAVAAANLSLLHAAARAVARRRGTPRRKS